MPVRKSATARKAVSKLLKAPSQSRAKDTVEGIKAAMARLVAASGYSSASTNAIAREAGISIGALYRYFPNRAAIVLALYEDDSRLLAERVNNELERGLDKPLPELIGRLARIMLDFMEGERPFLQQVIQEEPTLRDLVPVNDLERRVWDKSHALLMTHMVRTWGADASTISRKMFFIQHFSMGLMRRYVLERPAHIPRAAFIAEFTALVLGYIGAPAASKVSSSKR